MKTGFEKALFLGLVAAGLIATAATPAAAHHSFAAFNMSSDKTVTGTVRQVDWTNPHIWIWIDVPNDKGGADTFGFEGMSPNFLARRNWTKSTLKPGDKITVVFRPLRDGSNGGMFVNAKTPDGKVLTGGGGQAGQ
ncbi:MAG: hypothetical protein HY735_16030 [Verrucomicrobia bacterium]|nr:hypothetical protein [Verrucomicrobiota bacterium]